MKKVIAMLIVIVIALTMLQVSNVKAISPIIVSSWIDVSMITYSTFDVYNNSGRSFLRFFSHLTDYTGAVTSGSFSYSVLSCNVLVQISDTNNNIIYTHRFSPADFPDGFRSDLLSLGIKNNQLYAIPLPFPSDFPYYPPNWVPKGYKVSLIINDFDIVPPSNYSNYPEIHISQTAFTGILSDAYGTLSNIDTSYISLSYQDVKLDCGSGIFTFTLNTNMSVSNVSVNSSSKDYVISVSYNSSTKLVSAVLKNLDQIAYSFDITGTFNDYQITKTLSVANPGCSPIKQGKLYIVKPLEGEKLNSGLSSLDYKIVYTGDLTGLNVQVHTWIQDANDFTKKFYDTTLTTFTIENSQTVFQGTFPISLADGDYTIWAEISATGKDGVPANLGTYEDTHTYNNFSVGATSANPIINFLNKIWNEFKQWFISVIQYLFVPDATEFSKQLANGWIQPNISLFPNTTPTLEFRIPAKALTFGNVDILDLKGNDFVLDFSGVKSLEGYNTILTVNRLILVALIIFVMFTLIM